MLQTRLKVQNTASLVIYRAPRINHMSLHFFQSVTCSQKIKCKSSLLCYNSLSLFNPKHLSDLVRQVYTPERKLAHIIRHAFSIFQKQSIRQTFLCFSGSLLCVTVSTTVHPQEQHCLSYVTLSSNCTSTRIELSLVSVFLQLYIHKKRALTVSLFLQNVYIHKNSTIFYVPLLFQTVQL